MNTTKRWTAVLACLLVLSMVVTGCGGGASSSAPYAAREAAASSAEYSGEAAGADYNYYEDYAYDDVAVTEAQVEWMDEAEMEPGYDGGGGSGGGGGGGAGGSLSAPNTDPNRKIITTVDLQMESMEYDACVQQIYAAIRTSGGYIEYSDIKGSIAAQPQSAGGGSLQGMTATMSVATGANLSLEALSAEERSYTTTGEKRYMYLRIRVPQQNLVGFLDQVEGYGNVLTKQENAKDVTLEYVDIESHKKALEAEQERLLDMLTRAETVEDMIKLEERLSTIRYQLESYESRLRVYDNQISYSTVNLNLMEVLVYTEKPEDPIIQPTVGQRISIGFTQTLTGIKEYWINVFVWMAVNSIYLAVVLVALVVVVLLLRRYAKKHPHTTPASTKLTDGGEDDKKKEITASDAASTPWDKLKNGLRRWINLPLERLSKVVASLCIYHTVLLVALIIGDILYGGGGLYQIYRHLVALIYLFSYMTIPVNYLAMGALLVRRMRSSAGWKGKDVAFFAGFALLLTLVAFVTWGSWWYVVG